MSWSKKRSAVAAVVALAMVIPATAAHAGRARTQETTPGSYAGTSDLTSGWQIQSSVKAGHSGATISRPGYSTSGWLPLSRPETLMAGLQENGRYPHVFHSDNLAKVPTKQFDVNWWYRDRLTVHPGPGQHTFLVMNGVSGKADLWINGVKIADASQLQGSYSRLEYDITRYVRDGANAVALDVSRNDEDITKFTTPMRYLTQNQVDWNRMAPDQNTGLQFAPQLAQDGPVSVRNPHVVQHDANDLSTADLTVKADVRNNTAAPQRTHLTGTVSHGRTRVAFGAETTVPAHATRTVTISPDDAPGLHLVHPAIWWPYQLGGQPMYHLAIDARVHGHRSDAATDDFGGLHATAELIDLHGTVRARHTVRVSQLGSQDVRTVLRPQVPGGMSKTYFEKLTLTRGRTVVSRNVYWLSTKRDQVDWKKTHEPGTHTPANGFATFSPGGYADLRGLRDLGPATIRVHAATTRHGGKAVTRVTIRNVGHGRTPAVFTRADLFSGGRQVLPIRWSDNDVTLWPGEQWTVTARYSATELHGGRPTVRVGGWNTAAHRYTA